MTTAVTKLAMVFFWVPSLTNKRGGARAPSRAPGLNEQRGSLSPQASRLMFLRRSSPGAKPDFLRPLPKYGCESGTHFGGDWDVHWGYAS